MSISLLAQKTVVPRISILTLPKGDFPLTPRCVIKSKPMHQIAETILRYAPTDEHVLILGETGTGKELLAEAVHTNSTRKACKFLKVNCSEFPDELFTSEFFGHQKGSFTGAVSDKPGLVETARQGTIFLDEISKLRLQHQAQLLRFLETSEYRRLGSNEFNRADVRIIAASNHDLLQLAAKGKFMEDLYYRLEVLTCTIPPLRERVDDLLPLVRFIIEQRGRMDATIEQSIIDILHAHKWPGNIRELRNVIHRTLVLHPGDEINCLEWGDRITTELISVISKSTLASNISFESLPSLNLKQNRNRFERDLILEALRRTKGNISEAAVMMGTARKNFYQKMKIHNIPSSHMTA